MSDARDKFGWLDQALCATDKDLDPDVFFDPLRRPLAISICNRCPVRDQCKDRAEVHDEYRGVWAGEARRRKNPGPSSTTEYLAPQEQHRHSRHKKTSGGTAFGAA